MQLYEIFYRQKKQRGTRKLFIIGADSLSTAKFEFRQLYKDMRIIKVRVGKWRPMKESNLIPSFLR